MANMPAFQASDESSILSARTNLKIMSKDMIFKLVTNRKRSNSHRNEQSELTRVRQQGAAKESYLLALFCVTKMYPDSLSARTTAEPFETSELIWRFLLQ